MKRIPLTQGKFATVDDEDYQRVAPYKWRVLKTRKHWYAITSSISGSTTYLHRFITDAPKGMEVDHINRDGLDNRKVNLRVCTRRENGCNSDFEKGTSGGYRGVYRLPSGRFQAKIKNHKQQIYIGTFITAEEAARARDAVARELHGEFAFLNFPDNTAASDVA